MNNYKQENREYGLRSSFPLVLFTSRSRSSSSFTPDTARSWKRFRQVMPSATVQNRIVTAPI